MRFVNTSSGTEKRNSALSSNRRCQRIQTSYPRSLQVMKSEYMVVWSVIKAAPKPLPPIDREINVKTQLLIIFSTFVELSTKISSYLVKLSTVSTSSVFWCNWEKMCSIKDRAVEKQKPWQRSYSNYYLDQTVFRQTHEATRYPCIRPARSNRKRLFHVSKHANQREIKFEFSRTVIKECFHSWETRWKNVLM